MGRETITATSPNTSPGGRSTQPSETWSRGQSHSKYPRLRTQTTGLYNGKWKSGTHCDRLSWYSGGAEVAYNGWLCGSPSPIDATGMGTFSPSVSATFDLRFFASRASCEASLMSSVWIRKAQQLGDHNPNQAAGRGHVLCPSIATPHPNACQSGTPPSGRGCSAGKRWCTWPT
jgi:hypothetical protein